MEHETCSWCEGNDLPIISSGYDEHNGAWRLCQSCHNDCVERDIESGAIFSDTDPTIVLTDPTLDDTGRFPR